MYSTVELWHGCGDGSKLDNRIGIKIRQDERVCNAMGNVHGIRGKKLAFRDLPSA
jgi:hypothetical protein